jgi:hypothetical protein
MSRFSDKPAGSIIQEREDLDGLTLFWKPSGLGCARVAITGFLVFWLCGWTVGLVTVIKGLLEDGFHFFLVAWLLGWILGGLLVLFLLLTMLSPERPESVTLKTDSLHYQQGRFLSAATTYPADRGAAWGRRQSPLQPMVQKKEALDIDRTAVKAFFLERVGERQRLCFDHGADRIEIGACLREPEREWLFGILEAWRNT